MYLLYIFWFVTTFRFCRFEESAIEDLRECVARGEITFNGDNWTNVSAAGNLRHLFLWRAKHCIQRMLQVDPAKRITSKEIMHHPWFKVYYLCDCNIG